MDSVWVGKQALHRRDHAARDGQRRACSFGGSGYIWENPAARAFVDSRLATIGDGADEVMKEAVAKILKI